MKISNGYFFITLLAISTFISSVATAGDITCPPPKHIKSFASTLSASKFVIDGPGMFGMWTFEVKNDSFTFENRDWHLATWIDGNAADKIEEARNIAIKNVITLDDNVAGSLEEADVGYLCVYQGQYGAVMVGARN